MTSEQWLRAYAGLQTWQWLGLLGVIAVGTLMAFVLERLLLAVGMRLARLTVTEWDDQLISVGDGPLRLPLWAGLLVVGTRRLKLPVTVQQTFDLVARSVMIVAIAWFLQRFLGLASRYVEARMVDGDAAGRYRGVRTQMVVLRRVFEVVIFVVAAALLLIQFDIVRNVGVSLLASAGIAGLVIGLAAQKSLSGLLAGIQLSVTQPIRIGDSVVVEGEFGTVEEITLTYVVVRTWDLRRMVLPITHFLDKPFQNWSRGSSGILGSVMLQVDFTADVEAFRQELQGILQGEGKKWWDGKVQGLQVTDASDRTQTLRALVSAADPGACFDLRCLVRERLIAFLTRHPQWLPVTRSEARERPQPEAAIRQAG